MKQCVCVYTCSRKVLWALLTSYPTTSILTERLIHLVKSLSVTRNVDNSSSLASLRYCFNMKSRWRQWIKWLHLQFHMHHAQIVVQIKSNLTDQNFLQCNANMVRTTCPCISVQLSNVLVTIVPVSDEG